MPFSAGVPALNAFLIVPSELATSLRDPHVRVVDLRDDFGRLVPSYLVGRGSDMWRKRLLPLSRADERCVFRPAVLGALADAGIPWRTMFETGNIEAAAATVRAGLCGYNMLVPTVQPAHAAIRVLRARNDVERCCRQTRTVSENRVTLP
ncbi:hypothetical protein [Mycetohabitans sp. B46]|uniref:hypothetical protein n=1 Tax=Mycetohabitans sp. B46 TaxID=2772536 RepID=UPI00307E1C4F